LINSLLLASTGVDAVYHASKEKFNMRYDFSTPVFHGYQGRHHSAQIPQEFFDLEFKITLKPSLGSMEDLDDNSLQIYKEFECKSCRAFAYGMSTFLKYSKPILVEIGNVLCDIFIPLFGF
jgi:hypothetical protein